ncbi:hypothetical protein GCM10008024_10400 [Allgaiera indica]|uniref:Uncharacterized protein n=1 Tax=Allgaiera indica TaxID=765699 RepID=A0AAN4UQJ7_9RHOB|nr:hypothetical protein GCM10008024_10400 [Allgaiera indica]
MTTVNAGQHGSIIVPSSRLLPAASIVLPIRSALYRANLTPTLTVPSQGGKAGPGGLPAVRGRAGGYTERAAPARVVAKGCGAGGQSRPVLGGKRPVIERATTSTSSSNANSSSASACAVSA